MPPHPLPFIDLAAQTARLRPLLDARIAAVLAHGQFILGPEVAELETALARFAGTSHAVGVSSGTDALLVALMAEGVGPGDAVFVPGFTFPATAEAVLLAGAAPVFVDVTEAFLIDPADLEARVAAVRRNGRLRPRAVLTVDLFGLPADYRALGRIAEREGLAVIADAAQSFGAARDGRRVGALAPVTAVSFFPSKPLGAFGDGGALLTSDAARADAFRSIRAHGRGAGKYDIVRPGLNARLDTLQAAILLAKLTIFEGELAARERVAARYDARLGGIVELPPRVAGAASAWSQYTIKLKDPAGDRPARREHIRASLADSGIPTMVYYPRPLHLQPAYRAFGGGEGSLPVSEALAGCVLSLPIHPYLDDATADRIADAVATVLG